MLEDILRMERSIPFTPDPGLINLDVLHQASLIFCEKNIYAHIYIYILCNLHQAMHVFIVVISSRGYTLATLSLFVATQRMYNNLRSVCSVVSIKGKVENSRNFVTPEGLGKGAVRQE